jgi:hypothetical protein
MSESISLTRKERKALAKEEKRTQKHLEDVARKQKHLDMLKGMSVKLLESFENDKRMKLPNGFPVAVRVKCPLWDCKELMKDAEQLMIKFPSAVQYGGLHDGMWLTLCLRSTDGSTNNDAVNSHGIYSNSQAWNESTYIVPHLLSLLKSTTSKSRSKSSPSNQVESFFQRVRLSIIPPNCNVGWHVDYENTFNVGPIRMHIPIQCSDQFMMNIGGQSVPMSEGETWLGQFELPHRLGNNASGVVRIHLVVDMFPLPLVAINEVLRHIEFDDLSICASLPVIEPVLDEHVAVVVPVVKILDEIIPDFLSSLVVVSDVVPLQSTITPVLIIPAEPLPVELLIVEEDMLLVAEPVVLAIPLDWEPFSQSVFGESIHEAFDSLYRPHVVTTTNSEGVESTKKYDIAETIAASVAAFSEYRWGGPFANTTEARAAVEAAYYLK